jgi:threonine dehydrogenase-like Zn-dependent dehydrogenase
MLTHTFGLSQWQDAFLAVADQEASGAVKVAIDPAASAGRRWR